jgi:hypothetical protein
VCGPGSDGGANDAPLPAEGSSMTEVVFSARILLGLVFLVAGLTKLTGFREFSLALPRRTVNGRTSRAVLRVGPASGSAAEVCLAGSPRLVLSWAELSAVPLA